MTDNGQPGFPDEMGMNPTGNDPDATRRQASAYPDQNAARQAQGQSPYPDAGAPRAPRPPRQPGVRRGAPRNQQPAQPRSRSQAAAAMQGGGGRGRPPGGGYYDDYDDGYGQAGGDWIRMLVGALASIVLLLGIVVLGVYLFDQVGGDDDSPDTAAVEPTTAPIPEIDVFGCAGEENPVGQQPIPSAASIVGRDAGSRWLAFANPQRPPAQLWVRASDVPDFDPASVGTVPCTDNPEELPTPVGLATPTPFGDVADGGADDGGEDEGTDGETDGESGDDSGVDAGPTPVPLPTSTPLPQPTVDPNATPIPTAEPTAEPTAVPTEEPTAVPTEEPTAVPTAEPTTAPPLEPPNPRGEGGDGSGDGGEGDGGGL